MIWLFSFNGVELPKTNSKDDLATGQINAPTSPLESGSLDLLGSRRGKPQQITITTEGAMCSESRLRTFRKMLGKRGKLRRYTARGTYEDTTARLTQIKPTRLGVQENARVNMTFLVSWPIWENIDDGWFFDSGEFFDTGLFFDGTIVQEIFSSSPFVLESRDFLINNTDSEFPGGGIITLENGPTTYVHYFVLTNNTTGEFISVNSQVSPGIATVNLDAKSVSFLSTADVYYDNSYALLSFNNPGLWIEIQDGVINNFTIDIFFHGGTSTFTWRWNRRYL